MVSTEGKGPASAVLYASQQWKWSASSTGVFHFSVSPSLISHRKCDVVTDFVLCFFFLTHLQMKLGLCSPWCSKGLRIFLGPAMEVFWPSQSDLPFWLTDWSVSLSLPKTSKAFHEVIKSITLKDPTVLTFHKGPRWRNPKRCLPFRLLPSPRQVRTTKCDVTNSPPSVQSGLPSSCWVIPSVES